MSHFRQRSNWKVYLGLAGVVILCISLFYTGYLAQRLRQGERNKALLLTYAYDAINAQSDPETADLEADLTLPTDIITSNTDIPILLAEESGKVIYARNFGPDLDTNSTYLQQKLLKLKAKGPEPIVLKDSGNRQYLYYQNSRLHEMLTYFPYVQLLLLAAFIAIGYISINNARRAEQNKVWVGMAKETAHQLGTPVSAIIGWIEHLRESHENDPESLEVLSELQNDVDRLNLIADRFSKIGSAPVLAPTGILAQMRELTSYIRKRAPKKVVFNEPPEDTAEITANINAPLFNWVIENIMRNALDALEDGNGVIAWDVHTHPHHLEITISDTGKGIAASNVKTVFEPGFTTKTRGWGLGLSLARRIIENYHGGKIYVKHSKPGEGTTFAIQLPL